MSIHTYLINGMHGLTLVKWGVKKWIFNRAEILPSECFLLAQDERRKTLYFIVIMISTIGTFLIHLLFIL